MFIKQETIISVMVLLTAVSLAALMTLDNQSAIKWAFVLVIFFMAVTYLILYFLSKRHRKLILNREGLDLEEIYNEYYSDALVSKELMGALWKKIANILSLPPEKLRPTDRFGTELIPYNLVDHSLDELEHKTIIALKGISFDKKQFEKIQSVDEYVRFLSSLKHDENLMQL